MNISVHRRVMLSLLQKIYKHNTLGSQLGFKGGTSLYFLHALDRFSVDLDFNLLIKNTSFHTHDLQKILESEIRINDVQEKKNGWIWNGVYAPGEWNLKVEVSTRTFDDEYEKKNLLGLPLHVMKLEYQLTHKLCAIVDRSVMANRDIFDACFLLKKHLEIIDAIIWQRTGKKTKEYLQELIDFIPKHRSKRGMLDQLGQLIDEGKKQWVKDHLEEEFLFLLRARILEY